MGRRKIEIKKLENLRTRNATFKKRRQGILKKAHELAVLTDSKVTLSIQNGAAHENHTFNEELVPPAMYTAPAAQNSATTRATEPADTPHLEDGVFSLEEIKSVEIPSEQALTWPCDTRDTSYDQSIDSILDPLTLSVTNELCGYGLDLNPSASSFEVGGSPLLNDSLNDPFLSVEQYDDCNWLLPWLDWSPNVKGLPWA